MTRKIYVVHCPGHSGNAGCMFLPHEDIFMAYTSRKHAEREQQSVLNQLCIMYGEDRREIYQVDILEVSLFDSKHPMFTVFEPCDEVKQE
jgi:hypothetical protein